MVNLCVNLTGLRDPQRAGEARFLGVSVWGYFWKRWAFIWVGWVQITLTTVQPYPIHGSLSRTVEGGLLCASAKIISSCPWTSGHMVLRPSDSEGDLDQLSSGSLAFGLGWNSTTLPAGSPACRGQRVKLLSLHDCVDQFLDWILSYIYWFCSSGEP